jgi:hypothetical protein
VYLDEVFVPTVFYMIGKTFATKRITEKEVCNEVNRCYEVGRDFLEYTHVNIPVTKELIKPVDEACIILHGYNVFSAGAVDKYSSGKIAGEELVELFIGRSALIKPYFGEQAVRCFE